MPGSSASIGRPAVVFVEEVEDVPAAIFTGRFRARLQSRWQLTAERAEGLAVEQAVGRGRARAGLVLVGFGRRVELWSAGVTPHWGYPRWPPPDLPPLVPRPVPPQDWRRVGGAGSELMWSVTIRLAPSDVFIDGAVNDGRQAWDMAVTSAAAAGRMRWDRELLDGFLDDAGRALGGAASPGFATLWSPAYRVHAVVPALDAANAERAVAAGFAPHDARGRAQPHQRTGPPTNPCSQGNG